MKIRYFLRSWILKTSTLIIFSTLVTMLIMFLIIGSSLYRHLSAYILEQSTKYTDSIAEQVQQRLNSTLSEIDSNIQQLCNDPLSKSEQQRFIVRRPDDITSKSHGNSKLYRCGSTN